MPHNYEYIPVVFDTFGGVNYDGEVELNSNVFTKLAQNNNWPIGKIIARSWQIISCSLQSSVARQIISLSNPISHFEYKDRI